MDLVARFSSKLIVHTIETVERVALMTICWSGAVLFMVLHDRPPGPYSVCKLFENVNSSVPVNAGVGDADPLLKHCWAFGGNFLIAFVNIRLNHDTNDGCLAFSKLIANGLSNFWLVPVVLL